MVRDGFRPRGVIHRPPYSLRRYGSLAAAALLIGACRARPAETRIVVVTATPVPPAPVVLVEPTLTPAMETAEFVFPLVATPTARQSAVQYEISKIDADIVILRAKILVQEVDASSHGGLVGAISSATLATMKQTLAMIEQRRFRLEEQLPPGMVPTPQLAGSVSRTQAGRPGRPVETREQAPPEEPKDDVQLVDIRTRVTESNQTWDRVAWRLTLRNFGMRERTLNCDLEFQDSAGFVVKTAPAYGLYVLAGRTETFTGDTLLGADIRGSVANVVPKIRR